MLLDLVRWVHLLAASVWTGGLIVLAVLVVALRRAGADREYLRAAARAFGWASWTAMGVAIVTGILQVVLIPLPWAHGRLHLKIGLVALAVVLAFVHTLTARATGPALRGIIQLAILIVSLGIYGAAVLLR